MKQVVSVTYIDWDDDESAKALAVHPRTWQAIAMNQVKTNGLLIGEDEVSEDGEGWYVLPIARSVWERAEVEQDGEAHELWQWLAVGGGQDLLVAACEAVEEDNTGSFYEWLYRLERILDPGVVAMYCNWEEGEDWEEGEE